MTDVVVTVPKHRWEEWLTEGDLAGEGWSGAAYEFWVGAAHQPDIVVGERVYIVAHGRLRGYAPLVGIRRFPERSIALVRQGLAVAVTIPQRTPGFQGWRYRWWGRAEEKPFPGWKTP